MTAVQSTRPDTITVGNPADGSVVGHVPIHGAQAVAAKARGLRAAQPEWESLGPRGRRRWLLVFQDWVLDHRQYLIDVIQSETGKTRADAATEPTMLASLLDFWAGHAERYLADEHPRSWNPIAATKHLTTVYRPYPVVGVITPWNYPLMMPGLDAVAALAAGAAVLLKPSEVTPLSAVEFARGWSKIGAPPVLALATGYGETGAAVIANSDFVQFTGSTGTGRKVAVACGERLIPYSLELGGKDPALVLSDADMERATNGIIWGGMLNAGQVCVSVERVYVEAPVYDEFVAKLTDKVRALRQGQDDRGWRFDVGALATLAQRDIVTRHVDEAVAAGARVLTGGKPSGTGTFFEPTILVDVDHSMACMTQETFGPTLPIMKVADEAEAIRLANDSIYGLSATVWSRDKERAQRVARRLDTGAVNINDVLSNAFASEVPMGGWKQSGVGARGGGAHGIRKFCRPQAITSARIPELPREPLWYPASRRRTGFALGMLRAAASHGLRRIGFTPKGAGE
ncbi:aldehyde dehydrogenase family protein [Mycobacterium sp. OTB74]|uniref:aldehyde dehydrogenase family protein n=1 Tax=Mycobacterium sp. OTB74 TaxID=1853452 RepID=UPI002474F255|nr:aldehyde dehydrogenase family protein [Mycobacterium sp. OTB74]MDH6242481.1 acyl-CoA reductase-like NAD-dependent aldehyde dehydrogenase [Mycobacterium sp. OTB74]